MLHNSIFSCKHANWKRLLLHRRIAVLVQFFFCRLSLLSPSIWSFLQLKRDPSGSFIISKLLPVVDGIWQTEVEDGSGKNIIRRRCGPMFSMSSRCGGLRVCLAACIITFSHRQTCNEVLHLSCIDGKYRAQNRSISALSSMLRQHRQFTTTKFYRRVWKMVWGICHQTKLVHVMMRMLLLYRELIESYWCICWYYVKFQCNPYVDSSWPEPINIFFLPNFCNSGMSPYRMEWNTDNKKEKEKKNTNFVPLWSWYVCACASAE